MRLGEFTLDNSCFLLLMIGSSEERRYVGTEKQQNDDINLYQVGKYMSKFRLQCNIVKPVTTLHLSCRKRSCGCGQNPKVIGFVIKCTHLAHRLMAAAAAIKNSQNTMSMCDRSVFMCDRRAGVGMRYTNGT